MGASFTSGPTGGRFRSLTILAAKPTFSPNSPERMLPVTTARALLRPAGNLVLHVGSFAVTLLTWSWVLRTHFGPPASAVIIMGAPHPGGARLGGGAPLARPGANAAAHSRGSLSPPLGRDDPGQRGPPRGDQDRRSWRGWTLPLQPGIGWALIWITGLPGWVIGRQCSHDKVLVGGETGVDGGALVIVGVMPSARAIVAIVRERLSACLADSDD